MNKHVFEIIYRKQSRTCEECYNTTGLYIRTCYKMYIFLLHTRLISKVIKHVLFLCTFNILFVWLVGGPSKACVYDCRVTYIYSAPGVVMSARWMQWAFLSEKKKDKLILCEVRFQSYILQCSPGAVIYWVVNTDTFQHNNVPELCDRIRAAFCLLIGVYFTSTPTKESKQLLWKATVYLDRNPALRSLSKLSVVPTFSPFSFVTRHTLHDPSTG